MATTFGITDTGFVLKRLADLLTDKRATAVTLFQDLVNSGDVVDTSDSSILGRLINLDSATEAEIWQLAQDIYSSFDTSAATGITLDNLVAFGGLTRKAPTFTTSSVVLAGDTNTLIPLGNTVSSSTTNQQFTTTSAVALAASAASGVTITVTTVANTTAYTITYATSTTTNTISYTTDSTATVAEILAGLQAVIVSAHPSLVSSVGGTTTTPTLVIDTVEQFQTVNFTTSTNLGITKVRTIGQVVATTSGPIVQPANTIDTILTPVLGWDSVINPVVASSGSDLETDEELRIRFREGKYEKATNSYDALYSALINTNGVTEAVIYENDTSVVDSNGVAAHSFLPIVVGGLSTDIAEAIWENRPIGIISQGNTSVNVNDSQGFPHAVAFSRPSPIPIYITISRTTDSTYPANGDAAIRSAIIAYFAANLGVGDDVIYSRLYTPINSVTGFQVNSLTIGTTASPTGTTNIVIPFSSIASISSSNIIITS